MDLLLLLSMDLRTARFILSLRKEVRRDLGSRRSLKGLDTKSSQLLVERM